MNNWYGRLQHASPKKIRAYALFNVILLPFLPIIKLIELPIIIFFGIYEHTKELFLDVFEHITDVFTDIVCFIKRPKNKLKDYIEICQMLITGKLPDRIIKEFEEETEQ